TPSEPELVRPALDQRAFRTGIGLPDAVAEAVEPRVTRLGERGRQRHVLVDARLDVVEDRASEVEGAGAELRCVRRDDPGTECRLRDDRLERRAGWVAAGERAVEGGSVPVVKQVLEVAGVLGS